MAGRGVYDIDPLEKEILEHRAARRQKLRMEYLKESGNPYRMATAQGGTVDDIAVNRYNAMRASFSHFFKPTPKNSLWMTFASLIPIGGFMWIVKKQRDRMEHEIRSGQISYRDRDYKFK